MLREHKITQQIIKQAEAAFKKHQLIEVAEDRCTIASRHPDGALCSNHLTEIVSTRFGLYVGGDIDPVVFASSTGPYKGKINWIGTSNLDYVCEKATIGLNNQDLVYEYLPEKAVEDLEEYKEEIDSRWHGVIDEAIKYAKYEWECREVLHKIPDAWEWAVGEVPSVRVIYAWVAVKRLNELLEEITEMPAKKQKAASGGRTILIVRS